MATPNYTIDYTDEKFQKVEQDKKNALSQVDKTYNNMINQSQSFYQSQIDAAEEWGKQQQQLQQDQTDFAIQQIEQQKEQANKDYQKEQSGAYVDWQKQANKFGANAEQMAAQGLAHTGFSESSQISMYNTYQNRVVAAREVVNKAMLEYDDDIKEARLANNAKLAEIAFQTLQKKLELGLAGFQYENQLIIEQSNKKLELDQRYHNRYQDVLNQINQENALAEEVRQYNESLKMQQKQLEEEIRQYEKTYALQVKEYNEGIRQFNEEIKRLKAKDDAEAKAEAKRLELQRQQLEYEKEMAEKEYKLKEQQFSEEKRQFNESLAASKASSGGGSSGGAYIGGGGSGQTIVHTDYYNDVINPDVRYGTFATTDKNGVRYQPNNVGGSKLSKTGLTTTNNGVVQNVWKSEAGKYYYWEGRQNKYIQMDSRQVQAMLYMKNASGQPSGSFR